MAKAQVKVNGQVYNVQGSVEEIRELMDMVSGITTTSKGNADTGNADTGNTETEFSVKVGRKKVTGKVTFTEYNTYFWFNMDLRGLPEEKWHKLYRSLKRRGMRYHGKMATDNNDGNPVWYGRGIWSSRRISSLVGFIDKL